MKNNNTEKKSLKERVMENKGITGKGALQFLFSFAQNLQVIL